MTDERRSRKLIPFSEFNRRRLIAQELGQANLRVTKAMKPGSQIDQSAATLFAQKVMIKALADLIRR